MAKLQIQLNGKAGLAPKHFGNGLYSSNDQHLKYLGKTGQMASGIWNSYRYDGFMSPMPDQYQTIYLQRLDSGQDQSRVLNFIYSDVDVGSGEIVLFDDDGLYLSKDNPFIAAIGSNIDFGGNFTSPYFTREDKNTGGTTILAETVNDAVKSQYAGAAAYYYTWGDKIGRSSSVSTIGKVTGTSIVQWIAASTNPGGLTALYTNWPTLVNGNNQYIYVLDGSSIHGINVSPSGTVGNANGTFDSDIIIFQATVSLIDGIEHAGNIYLSISEGESNMNIFDIPNQRVITNVRCSVYIWNKISDQQLQANEIPLSNCKQVGRIWVMDGNIYVITVNTSNVMEIRILSGGSFKVLHEIGGDAEFNVGKNSLEVTPIGTIIATNKGNLFLLNKENGLVKLGVYASDVDQDESTLVSYNGDNGNEPSNTVQGLRNSVANLTIAYTSTDHTGTTDGIRMVKFYLHNHGTMLNNYEGGTYTAAEQTWLDANIPEIPLKANQGDVYTLVKYLPKLSTVNHIYIACKPTADASDSVKIATIKVYYNNSTTVGHEHDVYQKEASRGYIHMNVNEPNVNAIQLEIEWDTDQIMGENDFATSFALVDYTPTRTNR